MTDFRPGDVGMLPPRRERGIASRVIFCIGLALVAGFGWTYEFRPHWLTQMTDRAGLSGIVASMRGEASDSQFAALYQKFGMPPLTTATAASFKIRPLLVSLEKEPCDKQAVYQASLALEDSGARRGAAEMLKGFADVCPESSGERHRASELYYLLGDYDLAVKLASEVIDRQPDAQYPYFVRAKAEQGRGRYAAAVEDYTALIQLLPNTKSIVSEVFTRMSESYEKLGRPCEAIGPIQTYIALDSERRSTPALQKRVAALAAKGNCTQVYAKGTARIARRPNGVSTVKVEINGVEGTFVVDTGASFVTLSPSFANRAKPRMFKTDAVEIQTANGTTSAKLATVDSVKLDGVSASSVPTIIVGKSFGTGIDGLLGMSFLSRFTVTMQDRVIQLTAKTLAE